MRDLPSGTVTFLFTDIEGSTRLLHELGADAYAQALAEHRRVLRSACAAHGGAEVDTQGDAFFYAFPRASDALAAAADAQQALASGPIRVRMGLHTGEPQLSEEGYVGLDVHKAARICAAGHGAQILLSEQSGRLVESAPLRDLGEHRLKDLSAPERLYQLGDDDFPPLKTLYRTNLPIPATPFLGRERELAEVSELLSRNDVRLLTLTGPGGTGKTRLALQLAAAVAEHYPDGVWWAALASLRDPQLVLEQAAQVLEAKNGLPEHIADKRLLFLFDNFEHLTEAAPALADLLIACPNLELLATSREPLHLSGEREYAVPSLTQDEAVALFYGRAALTEPEETVRAICLRLDCLPLAVELAAARTKALSPRQILERLEQRLPLLTGGPRDAPERQRTLRATIEWSYELLSKEEQRLFARLAVFAGGCTLEAAEDVCDADLDRLQSLVEKSLVRHTNERFSMLETIREYATERLEESGTVAVTTRRMAEHLLELGGEEEGTFRSVADKGHAVARLEGELANLRVALDWALRMSDPTLAVRLAILPIEGRSYAMSQSEAMRWFDGVLRHIEDVPLPLRADALRSGGVVAELGGDYERSVVLLEQSLSLYRELANSARVINVLRWLGISWLNLEDVERARALLDESLKLATETADSRGVYKALHTLGELERQTGSLGRAENLLEKSAGLARRAGDDRALASTLHSLGDVALAEGEGRRAARLYGESLRIAYQLGLPHVTIHCLVGLASAAASTSFDRAACLWGAAEALEKESGWHVTALDRARYEELMRACVDKAPAAFAAAAERGRRMSLDDAVAYALVEID